MALAHSLHLTKKEAFLEKRSYMSEFIIHLPGLNFVFIAPSIQPNKNKVMIFKEPIGEATNTQHSTPQKNNCNETCDAEEGCPNIISAVCTAYLPSRDKSEPQKKSLAILLPTVNSYIRTQMANLLASCGPHNYDVRFDSFENLSLYQESENPIFVVFELATGSSCNLLEVDGAYPLFKEDLKTFFGKEMFKYSLELTLYLRVET